MESRTRKSYLYAAAAILFWATIPTAFKIGLGELDPLVMLTIATFTSAGVLLLLALLQGKLHLVLKTTAKDAAASAILGLINPTVYYLILLEAYNRLPGQVAQPLNMIWPIILVFLSVPILKQRIPKESFIALFISFAGVYIISSQGHPLSPGKSDTLGVLLATGSSFFWALYFIFNVKDSRDETVKLLLNFLFATVFLAAIMVIRGKGLGDISIKGLSASVYVGIFEMGITFFFWLKALSTAETSDKVSNLVYLAPFISMVFLYFIINEPVYITTPAGLLLIIAGIYIQNRKKVKP